MIIMGDVVAQLVERRPRDPMDSMTRPMHKRHYFVRVFPSQNAVLTQCRCASPPCVYNNYTHA